MSSTTVSKGAFTSTVGARDSDRVNDLLRQSERSASGSCAAHSRVVTFTGDGQNAAFARGFTEAGAGSQVAAQQAQVQASRPRWTSAYGGL